MVNLICKYCKTEFANIYNMNSHQKKAKYCLIIQDKIKNEKSEFKCDDCDNIFPTQKNFSNHIKKCKMNENKCEIIEDKSTFNCKYCNKKLSSKHSLIYHLDICDKKKDNDIENLKKEKDNEIENLKKELEKLKRENNNEIENLKREYKEQIKDLQNKLDKIANKAIDRPTITNNTVNNKIELQALPSQMEIDRKIESQFNDKYLWDGIKGVAQFVFDHIVKLEDGSMAYACFDTSRQIFKYKDENGNEIKDPKAIKLRRMIKPGLLKQSQTLLDYFTEECDYLEKKKTDGMVIDGKEYNTMNTLREKAFEVGCEILSIEETNKFSTELSSLSCI